MDINAKKSFRVNRVKPKIKKCILLKLANLLVSDRYLYKLHTYTAICGKTRTSFAEIYNKPCCTSSDFSFPFDKLYCFYSFHSL